MKYIKALLFTVSLLAAPLAQAGDDHDILLRGILKLGDSQAFSISTKAGAESQWLKVGQSFNEYKLKSFNEDSETLTIEAGEETFDLSMAAQSQANTSGSAEERLLEAQRMMNLMNFEKMMSETLDGQMDAMADMMRKQMSSMGQDADEEFVQFYSKAMTRMFEGIDWEPIKEGMTNVYAEVFTKTELEGISNFYTTPSGKASLTKMPEVQQKTMQVMMPAIMEASQSFQQELMQYMTSRKQPKSGESEQ